MIHHAKILALVLTPRSFLVAELAARSQTAARPAILNLAEFVFPENLSLNTPTELGQALGKFLASEKFSTRDAVIGLPARRLLSRRKDLPPAAPDIAASTLRLQAETEFPAASTPAGEADTFVFDYAGETSSSDPTSVLLVATAQSCVDQCVQLAKAANLKLRSITATSAALARASAALSPDSPPDALVLTLASGSAELIVQHGRVPTQLRHLAITNPGTPDAVPALAGEIRRSVASLQRNGAPLTLSLWNDSPSQDTSLLAQRLGFPVNPANIQPLTQHATSGASRAEASQLNTFAPAIAVGLAALHPAGLSMDFLHSRLAPPPEASSTRQLTIAIAVVSAIIAVIVAGFVDLNLKQRRLDDLRFKSTNQAAQVKVAQAAANRLDEANRWIHRTPRYTACMRDLTTLFPDEGSIWATSLTFNAEKNAGVLTGTAAGEPQVRALKDLMLKSKKFVDPQVNSLSENARTPSGAAEVAFSISFTYKPPATTTAPASQPKAAK